jgi:hypothetical protein
LTTASEADLEGLLRRIEADVSRAARRATRRALWQAAARYERSAPLLAGLLPPDLLRAALCDLTDPSVTWRVIRHLCRHIRFNEGAPLGSPARLMRCRTIAAGEVRLLDQQRVHLSSRDFAASFFSEIRRAAG